MKPKDDITEIDIASYIRYMGGGKECCHHHYIPDTPIEKEPTDYSGILIFLFILALFLILSFWMGYFLGLVRG